MPETTVTTTAYTGEDGVEREQYRTTIPKGLAEAYNLDGKKLDWSAETGDALRVTVVDQ
jgi:hypothetical protein